MAVGSTPTQLGKGLGLARRGCAGCAAPPHTAGAWCMIDLKSREGGVERGGCAPLAGVRSGLGSSPPKAPLPSRCTVVLIRFSIAVTAVEKAHPSLPPGVAAHASAGTATGSACQKPDKGTPPMPASAECETGPPLLSAPNPLFWTGRCIWHLGTQLRKRPVCLHALKLPGCQCFCCRVGVFTRDP